MKVARDARDDAKRVADVEVDRDHREYEPQRNGQYINEGGLLVYEFQLPHRYAVEARTVARGGAVVNDTRPAQRSIDGVWRVPVDGWTGSTTASQWDTLTIRFWPPLPEVGKPEPWSCRCRRDAVPGDGAGHWQWDLGLPQSADQVVERRTS